MITDCLNCHQRVCFSCVVARSSNHRRVPGEMKPFPVFCTAIKKSPTKAKISHKIFLVIIRSLFWEIVLLWRVLPPTTNSDSRHAGVDRKINKMSTPPTQKIYVLDLLRMLFSSAIYGVFIINVRWIEKSSFTKKSSGKKNHSFKVKEWSDLMDSVLRSIEEAAYFKSYKTTWNWHLSNSYSIFSCNWISWLSNLFFSTESNSVFEYSVKR